MRHALLALAVIAAPAAAQEVADMAPRDGWIVQPTDKDFATLDQAVQDAAGEGGLAVVTRAGPTEVAAERGETIPGNRVIGLFNNDIAVRLLRLSTPAMVEAPLRMYVTENADGMATLSYVIPSVRLAPYVEGSADAEAFEAIAAELDGAFAAVAEAAQE